MTATRSRNISGDISTGKCPELANRTFPAVISRTEWSAEWPRDISASFKLILRQNNVNPFDFSIILAVYVPGTNRLFRLQRYNGKSHEHTNHIEGETFYDFHIHMATERYQELGAREDAYAEPTGRYGDFRSALQCVIDDAKIEVPPDPQGNLFEEVL